jgi:hypothetical protein
MIIYLLVLPGSWLAVVRMPAYEYLRGFTESVEDELAWNSTDIKDPVEIL